MFELELFDRPIAYHRIFVKLGIGITGSVMLSQACYWSKRTGIDGWFWKTQEEWEDETGLTRTEQETARAKLRTTKFWEEKRAKVPAKLYFRIDAKKLREACELATDEDRSQSRMRK